MTVAPPVDTHPARGTPLASPGTSAHWPWPYRPGRLLDSAGQLSGGVDGPTTTIHFCGLGGSTLGALRAGLRAILAVNHDKFVCTVHRRSFPGVWVDCADLAQTDPERYLSTEVYQGSPACTGHTTAAGARRKQRARQMELFALRGRPILEDSDGAVRSRATMMCVLDHAEVHRYPIVLVENVLDATRWELFDVFLEGMRRLGYRRQRLLSINAGFVAGTPQDRDRLHMVFVQDGVPFPALDLTPPAPCPRCLTDTPALQTWTSAALPGTRHRVGEYGVQYHYTCGACRAPVVPYFRSALNVIDDSVPAPTLAELGDRLSETMRIRIQMGVERFGNVPLLLTNNCSTHGGRVRSLLDVGYTQTGSNTTAVLLPPTDAGEEELPEPAWVNARHPRRPGGLRYAVRSHSALVDPDREAYARRLYAGARAAARDLGTWRYRTLTPAERLQLQGFAPTHHVEGTHRQIHLMIGNANPPTVESELAVRAGAALRPDLYPAEVRPAA